MLCRMIRTPLRFILSIFLLGIAHLAHAQTPFLSLSEWTSIRDEASGSAPYENLRYLTGLHRVPATEAFDRAAEFMLQQAHGYGLNSAVAERFPIDGERRYGLMRSHLGWKVSAAGLWQVAPEHALIADFATDPIRLADYSHSAEVESDLIDVGSGMSETDYAGKNVTGKIVLADGVLSEVQALAVMKLGAAGIVSDMPNQVTAWAGQDKSLIRWGHLNARAPKGFAFMVSRTQAENLRAALKQGAVRLHANVQAEVGPGAWTVVSATIEGTDPEAGDIVYSCHLDHERPGANDNGSGCVTILEAARILQGLIGAGKIPRPLRTLRFIWGPEVEGTMAYLSTHADVRQRLRADVHLDMVGGDPFKNKSMLHVTDTPWSLPSFVSEVGASFAEVIRVGAENYAEDGEHKEAAVIEERGDVQGTRNVFLVDETPYSEGSDHDDYDSSTIAVPSIYLRDWPDVYIHTDHDSLSMIDPTKLRRVALLAAASGYSLAKLTPKDAGALLPVLSARAQQRLAKGFEHAEQLKRIENPDAAFEARNFQVQLLAKELSALDNFGKFLGLNPKDLSAAKSALNSAAHTYATWLEQGPHSSTPAWRKTALAAKVPKRIGDFGPLTYQNDDVLKARLGAERIEKIALLRGGVSHFINVQGSGELYAYEIVNFVDGHRTLGDIRDAVSAEMGPIGLEVVADYLDACAEAKIIEYR